MTVAAIPVKPKPTEFGFSVFKHLRAPQGAGYVQTFDLYCRWLLEELATIKHKDKSKLVLHSRTAAGRRRKPDLRSYEAWAVDCDEATDRPTEFLAALRGADCSFVYQERDGRPDKKPLKYHLVIPLAEPHFWSDDTTAAAGVSGWVSRLRALRGWLDAQTGQEHDKAMDLPNQGLRPYHRRPEDVLTTVMQEAHVGANGLDLGALLVEIGYVPQTGGRVRRREVDEASLKAFGHLIKTEAPKRLGGWYIQCPADHGDDHASKTWLRPDGTVKCLAGRCLNQPQSYFRALLDAAGRGRLASAQVERALGRLARAREYAARLVPLEEAAAAIGEALGAADPLETVGHVVRVTPGAGKTYAALRYLEGYSAPAGAGDESEAEADAGGRTAVIAFPTNALLREVAATVTIPHRVRTGVLGVVNRDGTAACLKWRVATEVQNAGGNVHKLLCARCEFKEGCPARQLSSRGEGSLVLTNHTLLPAVVRDLRGRGRIPLVVWDESPAMVDAVLLTWTDLMRLRARLLADSAPSQGGMFNALTRFPVWGEAETAGRLFGTDLLLSLRPRDDLGIVPLDLAQGTSGFARTDAAKARLRSLRSRLGLSVAGPGEPVTLAEVRETLGAAVAADGAATPYDQLSERERRGHALAWRIGGLVESALRPDARLRGGAAGVEVTAFTDAGRLWRDSGGVVLDATASRTLLGAVRGAGRAGGPTRVTDVAVADAPGVSREWVYAEGLSRTALKGAAERGGVEAVEAVLKPVVSDLAARFGAESTAAEPLHKAVGKRAGKAVVFVYKDMMNLDCWKALGPDVSLSYFGNVRGYNQYFRDGYTRFVTVGDPVTNIATLDSVASFLNADADALASEGAAGELTQAHGRARDVRPAGFSRHHLHYGRQIPLGWETGEVEVAALGRPGGRGR